MTLTYITEKTSAALDLSLALGKESQRKPLLGLVTMD